MSAPTAERDSGRVAILEKIAAYEAAGIFDKDVEDDPPTVPLDYQKVDFLGKRLFTRMATRLANRVATAYYERFIRRGDFLLGEVRGLENFRAVTGGAVLTANHFSPLDNYAVWRSVRADFGRRRLYKVIREGNYTSFPGLYGYFFRHCNTLPLGSNLAVLRELMVAVDQLLKRGEKILIYPEQGMWWNYRKPRPLKDGAFRFAARSSAPVVPFFITMEDTETYGADGFPLQAYTVHILEPIYPDASKNVKQNALEMKQKNYLAWKKVYEETYGIPLTYTTVTENKCFTQQPSQQQM